MLDTFFAGRRRPAAAPPTVTSAPTTSSYSSESLMGMYAKQSPETEETVSPPTYVANRSSYSPGEARKSLMAYMDSDNYSYAESVRSRPVSVLIRSGDAAGPDLGAGGVIGEERQQRLTTKRTSRDTGSGGSFLASVWALGFARERRSYAASVGSSAKNDDFLESDSEREEVEVEEEEEEEYEERVEEDEVEEEEVAFREARDKGKSRELDFGMELALEPSYLPAVAATSGTPSTQIVIPKVPEIGNMSPVDTRPPLDRNLSKSSTELRQESSEVAAILRKSPSLVELNDAEKDARQEEVREMLQRETELRNANAATTIQRAWRGSKLRTKAEPATPVVVEEPPLSPAEEEDPEVAVKAATTIQRAWRGSQQRKTEPKPVATEELLSQEGTFDLTSTTTAREAAETPENKPEDVPQAPAKSPRRKSTDVTKLENFGEGKATEPVVVESEAKAEVNEKALEEEEEESAANKTATELQDHPKALTGDILNPKPAEITEDAAVAEVPFAASGELIVDVAVEVKTEGPEPTKPEDVHPALRTPSPNSSTASAVAVDGAQKPIEAEAPATPAGSPTIEAATTVVEALEEVQRPSTPVGTKAPSITKTPTSIERRVATAFRRDSIRRSMSMFSSKKDKKPAKPDLTPIMTPAGMVASELTPPPTPPMIADQASLVERPKSRMSVFSLTKKAVEEKAATAAAASPTTDAGSSSAEPSGAPASEIAKDTGEGSSTHLHSELAKKQSLISIGAASSFQEGSSPVTSSGPLPAVAETSPEVPKKRPTFRPFSSGGKSRTQSWLTGRKPKVDEKGELVGPTGDDAASISPSVDQTPATPDDNSIKDKKFFSAIKRTPTFNLGGHARSVSSSAVSMASTTATNEDAAPSPTKLKGAARMKALAKASTFMGRKKEKGKGKELAVAE